MNEFSIKTPQQLGPILKGYRRDKGMNQQSLGAKVGLAQKAVSKMELAPEKTSVRQIFKLLAALDLELVVRPRGAGTKKSEW